MLQFIGAKPPTGFQTEAERLEPKTIRRRHCRQVECVHDAKVGKGTGVWAIKYMSREVIGEGKAAVFDAARSGWPWEGDEAFLLLGPDERYDLKARRPEW